MTNDKELASGITSPTIINIEKDNMQLPMPEHTHNSIDKISEEQRKEMIAIYAYFLAEQRGFTTGYEVCDWLTAEAEINMYII